MEEIHTTQQLLALRKLTRAIGDILGGQLKEYLVTLTPLFRQTAVFGENIQGGGKESPKGADQAFADLQGLYRSIATKPPFNLPGDLKVPLMQMTASLELTPWEYEYAARSEGQAKTVTVTSPFRSVLTYVGYTPQRLKELLGNRSRDETALREFVLHYIAMHVVIARRPGLAQLLQTLHFPIGSATVAAFGGLPVTCIEASISSSLPGDQMVIDSTELSGKDAFEELVNVSDIETLRDPLKDRLLELVSRQG